MAKVKGEDDIAFLHKVILAATSIYNWEQHVRDEDQKRLVEVLKARVALQGTKHALEKAQQKLRELEKTQPESRGNVSSVPVATAEQSKAFAIPSVCEWLVKIEISTRSRKCLEGHFNHDETLVELLGYSDAEMLRINDFGRKSLLELKEILHPRGLHLCMDEEEAKAACAKIDWDK